MLNYTSLFADLDDLFKSAGRDPVSFARLEREVERVSGDLNEYYAEVATDYVIRLEERLADGQASLSEEEADLLRAFLGYPPRDPERDARLVDTISDLEQRMQRLQGLKGSSLSLRSLDALRRQLDGMRAVLPGIVRALEERRRSQEFDEAVGDGGPSMNRDWLLDRLRRALDGSDETGLTSTEELRLGP